MVARSSFSIGLDGLHGHDRKTGRAHLINLTGGIERTHACPSPAHPPHGAVRPVGLMLEQPKAEARWARCLSMGPWGLEKRQRVHAPCCGPRPHCTVALDAWVSARRHVHRLNLKFPAPAARGEQSRVGPRSRCPFSACKPSGARQPHAEIGIASAKRRAVVRGVGRTWSQYPRRWSTAQPGTLSLVRAARRREGRDAWPLKPGVLGMARLSAMESSWAARATAADIPTYRPGRTLCVPLCW